LVESYRNVLEEERKRTVWSVGFLSEFSGEQINLIENVICERITGQQSLFEDVALKMHHISFYKHRDHFFNTTPNLSSSHNL
jgi:hypothetical protein